MSSVMRHSEATDGLLDILRLSQENVVVSHILAFFITVYGLCFENIKVLFQQLVIVADENNFGHVFAVGITEKSFLDLSSFVGWYRAVIDKVPKSNRTV